MSNADLYPLADRASGTAAMSKLADRLLNMAPPPLDLSDNSIARQSPAVAAALSASAAIAKRAHERARRSRRPIVTTIVDSFVSACEFVPYALVALGLRLIMARIFFLDGQTRIDGLRVPVNIQSWTQNYVTGLDFSIVLPMQVRPETFTAFLTQYPMVPVPPALSAYLVSYAEFILPVMLLIGLGTRFAALGLLVITAMIMIFVAPDMLGSVQMFWAAILLVLVSRGPGAISLDHAIRHFAGR